MCASACAFMHMNTYIPYAGVSGHKHLAYSPNTVTAILMMTKASFF